MKQAQVASAPQDGVQYRKAKLWQIILVAFNAFNGMAVYFLIAGQSSSLAELFQASEDTEPLGIFGLQVYPVTLIIFSVVLIVAGVVALAFVEQRLAREERRLNPPEKKYRFGALALLFPILYCLFDTLGTSADGIIPPI